VFVPVALLAVVEVEGVLMVVGGGAAVVVARTSLVDGSTSVVVEALAVGGSVSFWPSS
jgi:hypothetical protein